jgi:dCMP deaminase
MNIATELSTMSRAQRKKVGAIIVKNENIISSGFNGMPSGSKDKTCEIVQEDGSLVTKPEVLHAEANAILKLAAKGGVGSEGSILYLTMSPCLACAGLINQAKISHVFFKELYRDQSGLNYLDEHGVTYEQLEEKQNG